MASVQDNVAGAATHVAVSRGSGVCHVAWTKPVGKRSQNHVDDEGSIISEIHVHEHGVQSKFDPV